MHILAVWKRLSRQAERKKHPAEIRDLVQARLDTWEHGGSQSRAPASSRLNARVLELGEAAVEPLLSELAQGGTRAEIAAEALVLTRSAAAVEPLERACADAARTHQRALMEVEQAHDFTDPDVQRLRVDEEAAARAHSEWLHRQLAELRRTVERHGRVPEQRRPGNADVAKGDLGEAQRRLREMALAVRTMASRPEYEAVWAEIPRPGFAGYLEIHDSLLDVAGRLETAAEGLATSRPDRVVTDLRRMTDQTWGDPAFGAYMERNLAPSDFEQLTRVYDALETLLGQLLVRHH